MTKRVQIVGHATTAANSFLGREREVTVDTTTHELRVHDGLTTGGFRILNTTQLSVVFQPLDANLSALAALDASAGILVRNADETFIRRTLTGTAGSVTVSNGDGVSGNPTITLPATLTQDHVFSGAVGLPGSITLTAAGEIDFTLGTATFAAGQISFTSITGVQASNAALTSIAGLTTEADRMIYTTASDTYAVAALTSFGRSMLDDADAATVRGTLGLAGAALLAVGTTAGTVAAGDHAHTGVYEPADATILKDADIDVTVRGVAASLLFDNVPSRVKTATRLCLFNLAR